MINGGFRLSKEKLVFTIAEACDDKQAKDIVILNMKNISLISDYFLICHGTNERQIKAIANAVRDTMREQGINIRYMEGFEQARWVVIDAGDVLCHIFHEDERNFYNLERLWGDAERLPLKIGQDR